MDPEGIFVTLEMITLWLRNTAGWDTLFKIALTLYNGEL